jgi:hypothetical protein
MYLDAREGATVQELAADYDLPVDEVVQRLEAARLCFEGQVRRIEFVM